VQPFVSESAGCNREQYGNTNYRSHIRVSLISKYITVKLV
jgi:hypothetical protein